MSWSEFMVLAQVLLLVLLVAFMNTVLPKWGSKNRKASSRPPQARVH